MVFVLDDITKIESDRQIDLRTVETHVHVQETGDILSDPTTHKAIRSVLEPYLEYSQYYVWRGETTGVLGVFTDAFLNAGMWGNQNRPGKKITVNVKYGAFGSVIYIEDEGDGFDYKTQIEKLQRGEPHDHQRNGGGMRKFHEYHGHIAYHGKGNIISIATRVFSKDEFLEFARGERV